ncbi:type I-E CRISPR-associated protein Cas5/CasD [Zavarzinia compransoris]|uniref:Type I-E CRISPR-associated protein Cas5/CasD n=1 Tax=Zavarzinia compransoris TaxID=1264899 RepID=A0A317DWJ5_9PROT|nr:type I-E CRISPR-associated protein Cas5/CasD [Zavarzinia compransoris]PWR18802.1 type I-E CRISPR-associated protein Cas5/CasD [Zavarzinia compransoris]TDP48789.1 CRISPR-associated Cas5e family protein [Zavarzinia compransoris]
MTDWLVLVLDAPLMSFGGAMIDQHGVTRGDPGRSLLTGLIGNALGYEHRDAGRLEALQHRLDHASLHLRDGEALVDFHTVDLGQPFMRSGWTTRGAPQGREGGSAGSSTHIRNRHYLAGALRLVVLTLGAGEGPDLDAVETALREPARPLFLGRKTCLPARPLLAGRVTAADAVAALHRAHALAAALGLADFPAEAEGLAAEWPDDGLLPRNARQETVVDQRDWRNQFHGGERRVVAGPLPKRGGPP